MHSPLLQEPVTAHPLSVTVSNPASKKAQFERHMGADKGLNPLLNPVALLLNEEFVERVNHVICTERMFPSMGSRSMILNLWLARSQILPLEETAANR